VGCNAAPKSEENVGPATGAVKQNRLCVEGGNGADRLSAGRIASECITSCAVTTPAAIIYLANHVLWVGACCTTTKDRGRCWAAAQQCSERSTAFVDYTLVGGNGENSDGAQAIRVEPID
jgi:hypothetical protein